MAATDRPADGLVDVWVAPLDVAPPLLDSLVASLTPDERARAGRYRDPDDARRFSAGRGWLRQTLGAALGVPAGRVPLLSGPGKPQLVNGPCFNISHARGLALIAVANREVGVDVEHRDSGARGMEAARIACSEPEAAGLQRLPADERADAFLGLWTAKEAYLKAIGLGLSLPPDEVEVVAATADPVAITTAGVATGWFIRRLEPAPGYMGAVAAEGRAWSIRLHPATDLDQ